MKCVPIPHLSKQSQKNYFDFSPLNSEPLLLKGGATDWPAVKNWSMDYLTNKIGNVLINYRQSDSKFHPNFTDVNNIFCEEKNIKLKNYLTQLMDMDDDKKAQHIISGDNTYLYHRKKLNKRLQPIIADLVPLSDINLDLLQTIGLWISTKGLISWLHYDSNAGHNFNVQITGRKKVFLFSPHESHKLYLFNAYQTDNINFSQINIAQPDYQRFRNFKNTTCYTAELFPGDILFIPAYWLHSFEHIGDFNININYWWDSTGIPSNPLLVRYQFLRALNLSLGNHEFMPLQEREKALTEKNKVKFDELFNNIENILLGC